MERIKNTRPYLWQRFTNEMKMFVSLSKLHTHTRQALQDYVQQVCTGGYLIE
jgi:hypothetical protein